MHAQWFGSTRRALDARRPRRASGRSRRSGPKLRPDGPVRRSPATTPSSSSPATSRRFARREQARFLAATPRELETLKEGGVRLDLLVGSGTDPGEHYDGSLDVGVVCATEGARGGVANGERYDPAPPPGPLEDTYGAGDSFAAALCFALARGDSLPDALALAARGGRRRRHGKGAVLGANHALGVDRWGIVG